MVDGGRRHRQGEIDIDLAEEEPRAAVLVDQAGVLADPAEAGVAGERAFEHRRRIDEHPMPDRPDDRLDALGEFLQALSHQLVVIAAQCITRDVGAFALRKRGPGFLVFAAVVETDRDHRNGAGDQFIRARALVAVRGHPLHRAVHARVQPAAQVALVIAQFNAADAEAGETERCGFLADPRGQRIDVGVRRHARSIESRHAESSRVVRHRRAA